MWHHVVTHVLFTNNLHDEDVAVNKQSIRGRHCRCVALQNAKTLEDGVNMAMHRYCSKKLHLQSYLEMLWSETGYFGLLGNKHSLYNILLYLIER